MKKLVAVAVAVVGTFRLFATDIVWQGPTEGNAEWTAPENWVGGEMPGEEDCAVFGEGIGTLSIINTTSSAMTLRFKDFKVQSGTITFVRSANTTYYLNNATNLFTIAPGAKVIWECGASQPANNVISIHVAGGGTWQGPKYGGASFGTTGWGGRYMREVRAKEGSTVTFPGYGSYIYRYVAEKDASLTIGAISSLHGFEVFEAQKGGTINISNGNGNNTVGAICGEGTVKFSSSGYNYPVTNVQGPNTFSGTLTHSGNGVTSFSDTVDEEKNRLIVGSSNAFEKVWTLNPKETRFDFAAGIGTFYFGNITGQASNPIIAEDLAGEPIRLHTGALTANAQIRGSGDWFASKTMSITGDQVRVTGVVGADAGATLTIGNGTDEGAVDLAGRNLVADGTIAINNGSVTTVVGSVSGAGALNVDSPLDVKGPLAVASALRINAFAKFEGPVEKLGDITPNAATEFLDVRATSIGTITLNADVALVGHGQFAVCNTPDFKGGDLSVFNLGLDAGWSSGLNNIDSLYTTKKRAGRVFNSISSADSTLVLGAGGSWRQGDGEDSKLSHVVLKDGGRMIIVRGGGLWAYPAEAGRLIESDGGVIEICAWQSIYGINLLRNATEQDYWTLKVGAKGHCYDYRSAKGQSCCGSSGFFSCGLLPRAVSDVAEGRDGGIVFNVGGRLGIGRPQSVTGPVRLADGAVVVASGAVTGVDGLAFGTGDLVMDGGWLAIDYSDSDLGLKLAGGEGAKFRLESPSQIELSTTQKGTDRGTLNTPQTITIGPEGGEGSPIIREKGGVLFVSNFKSGSVLDGTTGKLLVNGPVETYADGRVKLPVVAEIYFVPYFMAYDSENGFVKYANCADAIEGAGSETAVDLKASAGKVTIAAGEEKSVGGIRFTDDLNSSNTFVEFKAGSVLRIGDGVNPALVMYGGGYSSRKPILFTGDGTIDFGTSEGVFAIGERGNIVYNPKPEVRASIAGSGGVTFASAAGADDTYLILSKPSTYTGGTIIGNLAVTINDGAALGRDAVKVCDGNVSGGAVKFNAAMTVTNDFMVAGHGIRNKNPSTTSIMIYGKGALWFAASDVHLTGSVVMGEEARITAYGAPEGADSGIFEGVISGGHLQVFYAQKAPIVFTKPNTYTGGTEIVSAAVTLRGAGTLGSGDVLLDQGVLRFENDEEVTFTNYVRGKGVFQLAGTAPVHFRGDYSDIESAAVDLAGARQVFTELPPFATITNSAVTRATLVLAENLGTVAWGDHELVSEKEFDIEIGEGTLLDLGGATLRVRRARNGSAKRVVNGEFIESKPEQGLLLLVR